MICEGRVSGWVGVVAGLVEQVWNSHLCASNCVRLVGHPSMVFVVMFASGFGRLLRCCYFGCFVAR